MNAGSALPQVPAAMAVGISAATVARPDDFQEAGAQIVSFLDDEGRLVGGVALELAPLRMLGRDRTVDQWRETGDWTKIAESIRLSFATTDTPPSEDAGPLLAAVGLRVRWLDERDYRYNRTVIEGVRSALARCFPTSPTRTPHRSAVKVTCDRSGGSEASSRPEVTA